MRADKPNYYLNIAEAVLERSTCIRRHFGSVLTNEDIIISTGYNGSMRGDSNCCDNNSCIRNEMNCASGEGYEYCIAIHAEQNAIINVSRRNALGGTLFLVGIDVDTGNYFPIEPCYVCMKLIKVIGIRKIFIRETKEKYKIIELPEI